MKIPVQHHNHAFNPIYATAYGVPEAILIAHFQFWINSNLVQGINRIEGRTWTYQTRKQLASHYSYFTEKQVRRAIDSLVKQGVLVKGNFNKKGFDQTNWYAFKNEELFTVAQMGHSQKKKTKSTAKKDTKKSEKHSEIKKSVTSAQKGQWSAQKGQPIPDTNPNILKENTTTRAAPGVAPAARVVFSCIDKLELPEKLKLNICKNYTEPEVEVAVKRTLLWVKRKSDAAAVLHILRNPSDWHDPANAPISQNQGIIEKLQVLDRAKFGKTQVSVGSSYIEFITENFYECIRYTEALFVDRVKKILSRIGGDTLVQRILAT